MMKLHKLLTQTLSGRHATLATLGEDREVTRDDVRAVAAVKAIRDRTPAMKSVDVSVVSVEDRDDNWGGSCNGRMTNIYSVTVTASSDGGDWSYRRIEVTIPMIIAVTPYGEVNVECDCDRESECSLRSTGRRGDDQMIGLPTFGNWLQRAAGVSLLEEWLVWHGAASLVASQPV